MTRPDPGSWDADLSRALTAAEGIAGRLAIWQARTEPDAHARRCASDAITAIDTAAAALGRIRARLITEARQADDAALARADELLAAAREGPPGRDAEAAPGSPQGAASREPHRRPAVKSWPSLAARADDGGEPR